MSEKVPCQFYQEDKCPVFVKEGKCYEDRHHLYYPSSDYQQPLERRFRGLGANIVMMCRNLHNLEHHVLPKLEKPTQDEMREAIEDEEKRS